MRFEGDGCTSHRQLACFSPWHQHPEWGDSDALDAFSRLLGKSVIGRPWLRNLHLRIRPRQIRSERVMRTTIELAARFVAGHQRDDPADINAPLIIAVYAGREFLLDGYRRINYWLHNGDNSAHLVHVHHIEGPGEVMVLPPVK